MMMMMMMATASAILLQRWTSRKTANWTRPYSTVCWFAERNVGIYLHRAPV